MDLYGNPHTIPSSFGRGWIPAGRDIGLPADEFSALVEQADSSTPVAPAQAGAHPASPTAATSPEPRGFGWTAERKVRFLDALSSHGNVRAACARVGLSAEAAYKLRRRDALFAAAWSAAMVLARDHAEQVLATRALEGFEEPVFYRGELVGHRVRHDGRLLLAHLARLDRRAEEPRAEDRAARFDELVALAAGLAPPPELEIDPVPAEDDPWCRGPDPLLPVARESFVADAGHAAAVAERARAEAAEADEDEDEDDRDDEFAASEARWQAELAADRAAEEAAEAAVDEAGRLGRLRAAALWDGWVGGAVAHAEAILRGERPCEAGGGGLAVAAAEASNDLPGPCQPCQPAPGAEPGAGSGAEASADG